MDPDTRTFVTWLLGTTLSAGAVVGLAVKFILLPYLREHLIRPVAETRVQVTENNHAEPHDQPTVMDRLDDVQRDVGALSHVMDVHMDWSERKVARTDRQLKALRKRLERQQQKGTDHDQNPTA